ncbi:MAG TPA: hypothetical protein VLM91_13155 [Candidatus Methylomirabilis sp.]|nr:hypothetical protein [Candidatus Methylomirabilis sp.]
MGPFEVQFFLLFGSMALAYGVVAWIGNLRRGEDFTTSLTHGPALIVCLIGFLLFVGGGSWLIRFVLRALFGS